MSKPEGTKCIIKGNTVWPHPDAKVEGHGIWDCAFNGVSVEKNGGLAYTNASLAELEEWIREDERGKRIEPVSDKPEGLDCYLTKGDKCIVDPRQVHMSGYLADYIEPAKVYTLPELAARDAAMVKKSIQTFLNILIALAEKEPKPDTSEDFCDGTCKTCEHRECEK